MPRQAQRTAAGAVENYLFTGPGSKGTKVGRYFQRHHAVRILRRARHVDGGVCVLTCDERLNRWLSSGAPGGATNLRRFWDAGPASPNKPTCNFR